MAAALRETGTAMAALASSASRADADAAATAMAHARARSRSTHLDHEEAMSEPLFAEQHDDPAIKEMGKKFGKQPLGRQPASFFAWVTDGAGPEEMAALKAEVPGAGASRCSAGCSAAATARRSRPSGRRPARH